MKKKIIILLLFIIGLNIASFVNISNVHAIDDVLQKISYYELYHSCYKKGILRSQLVNPPSKGLQVKRDLFTNNSDGQVILPNNYGHNLSDNDLSCKQLVMGYSGVSQKWTGLFRQDPSASTIKDANKAKALLKELGYVSKGDKADAAFYIKFPYQRKITDTNGKTSTSTVYTPSIKITNVVNNKITKKSTLSINNTGSESGLGIKFSVKDSKKAVQGKYGGVFGLLAKKGGKIKISEGEKLSTFVKAVHSDLKKYRKSIGPSCVDGGACTSYGLQTAEQIPDASSADDVDSHWWFAGNSAEQAGQIAIKKGNFNSEKALYLTTAQKTKLHQYYFKSVFKAEVICKEDNEDAYNALTEADSFEAEAIKSKTCRIKGTSTGTKVHAAYKKDNNQWAWHKDMTLAELAKDMTEAELLGAADSTGPEEDDPDGSGGGEGGSKEAQRELDCHTNAGALGWFLCPVIDASSVAVEKVYVGLIEPYLKIDASFFDSSSVGGEAVRNIWSIFQGFANLAFAIVFLFVIFSQLTGAGIDNYGIKKILPKLIIGAILINLSYIICQICVDLSNILGMAVGSMFKNMAGELDETLSNITVNLNPSQASAVSGKFELGVPVVVGIAAILGIKAFHAAGFAVIIPALVALVTLVIGVLFLFILLALRQAIAVILVVISPMAFAAYILPNTKKMFDKWYEAFKGMLIAYPVCSALVYGGDFVSKILLISDTSSGHTQLTSLGIVLSAAAVAIAPIFFIPGVIKKGMNGIAGLGNMIDKMQRNVGGAAATSTRDRLNNSRLTDYKRRKEMEHNIEGDIRRGEYNAKKAKKARDKYQKILDEKGTSGLKGAKRRNFQTAMTVISQQEGRDDQFYENAYSGMGVAAIKHDIETMGSKMNASQYKAGLNRIGQIDQGEVAKTAIKFSESQAFQNADDRDMNKIIQTLLSQDGNYLTKAYGKGLGASYSQSGKKISFAQFASETDKQGVTELQKQLQNMGTGVFNNADKDVNALAAQSGLGMNLTDNQGQKINVADMFSSQQIAAGMGLGQTGKDGASFDSVATSRSTDHIKADLQAVTASQLSNIQASTVQAVKTAVQNAGVDVKQELSHSITEIQKSGNEQLLTRMSQETKKELGINAPAR